LVLRRENTTLSVSYAAATRHFFKNLFPCCAHYFWRSDYSDFDFLAFAPVRGPAGEFVAYFMGGLASLFSNPHSNCCLCDEWDEYNS
jgi:hypothetical protein